MLTKLSNLEFKFKIILKSYLVAIFGITLLSVQNVTVKTLRVHTSAMSSYQGWQQAQCYYLFFCIFYCQNWHSFYIRKYQW